jgi:hypothetical protein
MVFYRTHEQPVDLAILGIGKKPPGERVGHFFIKNPSYSEGMKFELAKACANCSNFSGGRVSNISLMTLSAAALISLLATMPAIGAETGAGTART